VIAAMALAALLAALPGCGAPKTSDRDIEYLTVDEAIELAQGRDGVLGIGSSRTLWIDPRTPAKFSAGHIPGAINLQLEEVRADHPALRDFDAFIVYGDDYNEPIAAAMVKRLIARYDDVVTLRGGLNAWTRAGNELESGG
jgi:rhodanese-related sulfurtransferase